MVDHSRTGRPAKRRDPVAGALLRQALRILGKTWRKNTQDPAHVLNWDRWAELGLPRSSNTIDADIRLGIPEDRLQAYADCLGITGSDLTGRETDLHALLSQARRRSTGPRAPDMGFGPEFQADYGQHNSPQYMRELFALIGGVYRVYYVLDIFDFVNRCAFWYHTAQEDRILGRGLFHMFGLENPFESVLYRWHNNLHSTYLCQNRKELGHFLLRDPLRHNLLARRNPFWMQGQGLTDSGLTDNMPVRFIFRMEKVDVPTGSTLAETWEREREALRRKSCIRPGEAGFDALRQAILTPDRPG